MPLLNLPPEIFERIILKLVLMEQRKILVKHREVCRTFDNFILAGLAGVMARFPMKRLTKRTNKTNRSIFKVHGARILQKMLQNPPAEADNVSVWIWEIADALVIKAEPTDLEEHRLLRARYAECICEAVTTVDCVSLLWLSELDENREGLLERVLPAAAAAAGSVKAFEEMVNGVENVFKADLKYFPNILKAAVAANQLDMVRIVVARIQLALREATRYTIGSIQKGVHQALSFALRTHRNNSASLILQAAFVNDSFISGGCLFELCVTEGNAELIEPIVHHLRAKEWSKAESGTDENDILPRRKIEFLLEYGSEDLVRHIINKQMFDANAHQHRSRMAQSIDTEGAQDPGNAEPVNTEYSWA
ncbi:hypothetical protein EJ07DRAFT_150660 [Lizonia empirigonia]|nr:hypothetical protein EJ07DRAFT_150660 [Lizonia empirigonia]